jgi:crossover junction endodeoxyribonuclease RuvC
MKYLGIDPGIEITGFGIVEVEKSQRSLLQCGVIRTETGLPLPERLSILAHDLRSVLAAHSDISIGGVEELFFSKNAKSAFAVGQARGVILFTLHELGITIHNIKPVEVKSIIAGNGRADKKEMQRTIQLIFGLEQPPEPDDAADAVAIALATAHVHQHQY